MSTHNICFYEKMNKKSKDFYQIADLTSMMLDQ